MTDVEPKWYPDASRPGFLRYWDGQAWTEHVAPDPAYAPPVQPPAKKSRTGLVIGLAAGGAVLLALIVTIAIVIAVTVVPRLNEPHYAVDAPAGIPFGSYPAGFTPNEDFESGVAQDPSDPLDPATPSECTDLYYTGPESSLGSSDYTVYTIASASSTDGGYVDAYARVFDSADAAKSFLANTSDTIDACADGYTIPNEGGEYSTSSVTPVTITSDIESVAWSEAYSGTEADGMDFTAADLRLGNLVLRASCTADADVCDEFWESVTSHMRGIETD